jgi:hypothetical protein
VSERDTHFQQFALRLWNEMLGERGYIDVNEDYVWDDASKLANDEHRKYIDLLAQHAYDLVKHTLLHIDAIDLVRLSPEEQVECIPDMAERKEQA